MILAAFFSFHAAELIVIIGRVIAVLVGALIMGEAERMRGRGLLKTLEGSERLVKCVRSPWRSHLAHRVIPRKAGAEDQMLGVDRMSVIRRKLGASNLSKPRRRNGARAQLSEELWSLLQKFARDLRLASARARSSFEVQRHSKGNEVELRK